MIGTANPKALAEFYEKVFEKKPDPEMSGDVFFGWQVGSTFFNIGERIILNLETDDVKEEFDRLKSLGAEVVKEPYEIEGMWIATFADPDGNYFQLMSPWKGQ
jgi:predicted enzyme related to lactoylglutathione lyase